MTTSDAEEHPIASSETEATDGAGMPGIDRLTRLSRERRLEFSFAVGSMPFHAHLWATPEGARMRIAGDIGTLPFTAESAEGRRALAHALRDCPTFDWGGLAVTPNNRILVHGEANVPYPISPFAVVRETSRFVLTAYPVISLILDYSHGARV